MQFHLSKIALLIGLLLAAPGHSGVRAYPIAPVPLDELLRKSDFIGVVKATKITGDFFSPNEDGRAFLAVEECWRGPIHLKELVVPVDFSTICPAPPDFKRNELRLVFLKKQGNSYSVIGLDYGTKKLDHLPEYRAAFNFWTAMQGHLKESDRCDPKRAELAWNLGLLGVEALEQEALWSLAAEANSRGQSRFHQELCEMDPSPFRMRVMAMGFDGEMRAGEYWTLWAIAEPREALDWLISEVEAIDGKDSLAFRRLERFLWSANELEFPGTRYRMGVSKSASSLLSASREVHNLGHHGVVAYHRTEMLEQLRSIRRGLNN